MSSAAAKRVLKEFKSITGCNDRIASDYLKQHNYQLEQALNGYYSSAQHTAQVKVATPVDTKQLTSLFEHFKSPSEECLADESLQAFFTHIGISESNAALTLVIAYQLHCQTFGEITRREFVDGFAALRLDSVDKLRHYVNNKAAAVLKDPQLFKSFYRWLFDFIKEEHDRKVVETAVCCEMWQLVLPQYFRLLNDWLHFVQNVSKVKSISKDVWEQLFEFAREVSSDVQLNNWDESSAWPVLIDEFVEWKLEKSGKR